LKHVTLRVTAVSDGPPGPQPGPQPPPAVARLRPSSVSSPGSLQGLARCRPLRPRAGPGRRRRRGSAGGRGTVIRGTRAVTAERPHLSRETAGVDSGAAAAQAAAAPGGPTTRMGRTRRTARRPGSRLCHASRVSGRRRTLWARGWCLPQPEGRLGAGLGLGGGRPCCPTQPEACYVHACGEDAAYKVGHQPRDNSDRPVVLARTRSSSAVTRTCLANSASDVSQPEPNEQTHGVACEELATVTVTELQFGW
jgi:hypothetical protein